MRKALTYSDDIWLPDCNKIFEDMTDSQKQADFQMTAKLGQGSYGKVVRVKSKKSGEEYAMKIIAKSLISNLNMFDQMKNEINIMMSLSHKNIIELYSYFEDHKNMYLIMEMAEEKHLYQRLKAIITYDEKEAAKIIYDILQAVYYLHSQNPPIIHRDIKPENILFANNETKLSDFGWSNIKARNRTTLCGTPDYLAPEMIQGKGHTEKLDIWTIGVLLYELLNGNAPFRPKLNTGYIDQKSATKILEANILKNEPQITNETLSQNARDVILMMLTKDPNRRPSAGFMVNHEFFQKNIPKKNENKTFISESKTEQTTKISYNEKFKKTDKIQPKKNVMQNTYENYFQKFEPTQETSTYPAENKNKDNRIFQERKIKVASKLTLGSSSLNKNGKKTTKLIFQVQIQSLVYQNHINRGQRS